jgi:hypothetical protein
MSTPDADYNHQEWRDALGDTPARDFRRRIFSCSPAMVKKQPVNGHRMWTEYDPATFSDAEYDIVPGMWDHEHCSVCGEKIQEGDTFWQNSQKLILCLTCYAKFQKRA